MSYVTIYKVDADGDVVEVGEGSNNHTFAPLVWSYLGKKYGYGEDVMSYSDDARTGLKRLWKEWPSPQMTRLEHILLGSTFDFMWVPRELLPELIEACEVFYREHIAPIRSRTNYKGQTETYSYDSRTLMGDAFGSEPGASHYGRQGIIPCLKEIYENPTARGSAFNCCSAVASFWYVYDVPHTSENEDGSIVHTKDEDCAGHVEDKECKVCGVWHDEEACEQCGATAFHKTTCSEYEWGYRPWNIDRDTVQPRHGYRGKSAYNLAEELKGD